jgi:hypothetical protein
MAIDPNVFYRATALKGQLSQQYADRRQQTVKNLASKVGNYINKKQDQYDQNMTDFNGEIPREVVPEETMMQLTRHIAQEKAVYTANAKIMRSSFSRKKKREAAEENEKIKTGLSKVYADYQGAHDMGKVQEKNIQNIDQKYGDEMARDNSLNFANQEWYKSGIKFSRDGMTIDDVKEDENGKIVTHDKRLSDFKFAKPVQGLGENTFNNASTALSKAGEKDGKGGVLVNEDFLKIEKNKYVKAMKSLSPEEQRQFYFNGMSGEPGTAQADIDAMKQIGMNKADYDVMMDIQDEDAPGYQDAMNKREEFEQAKKSLGFRKDFLTPQMIDSQWNTLTNVYNSRHQEGSRLLSESQVRSNKKQDKKSSTIPVNYGGGYITRDSAENIYADIKNKRKIKTLYGDQLVYDKDKDSYVYATDQALAEGQETPDFKKGDVISNYNLLTQYEIWNQGYRLDDFAGTQTTLDDNEEQRRKTLEKQIDDANKKEEEEIIRKKNSNKNIKGNVNFVSGRKY